MFRTMSSFHTYKQTSFPMRRGGSYWLLILLVLFLITDRITFQSSAPNIAVASMCVELCSAFVRSGIIIFNWNKIKLKTREREWKKEQRMLQEKTISLNKIQFWSHFTNFMRTHYRWIAEQERKRMSARLFITLYMKIDWNNKLKRLTIRQGYYDSSNENHGKRNTYLEFQLRFLSSSSAHEARGRLSDTFWSRGEIISLQFPAQHIPHIFWHFPI